MAKRHGEKETSSSSLPRTESEKSLLNRRSYLKTASAAVAAVAGVGAAGTATAAKYDTITIGAGQRRIIRVGSGETFENKLIDITARNADVRIIARGSGWTIRNVGIKGSAQVGNDQGGTPSLMNVSGNGVVDTVYLGDGVSRSRMRKGGVGTTKSHSGHVDFRNLHIAGFPGTPLYAAASSEGGRGTIAVNDSYFRDNNISHIRIAANGSSMDNCVIHNTNNVPAHPTGGGTVNSRGIYTGYGDPSQVVEISDCDVKVTPGNTNGASAALVAGRGQSSLRVTGSEIKGAVLGPNVRTSNNGSNPDTTPPAGVPLTPEAAASGETGDSGNDDEPREPLGHTLTLEGTGTATNYEFAVDGKLRSDSANGSLESWDTIDDTSATGWVTTTGHADGYQFDGEITSFGFLEGEAVVVLDGEEVDPATLGNDDDASESPMHTLEIEGTGTTTNYAFSVSDTLEAADDSLEAWDTLDGASAEGWVTSEGHADKYQFTGDVTGFQFRRGDASVTLDGQTVDPETLGTDEPSVHTLEIEGTGTTTNYAFSVSDTLEAADDSLEAWDILDGASTEGWVTSEGHADKYQFTGDVTDFQFRRGDATVLLDGEATAPADL